MSLYSPERIEIARLRPTEMADAAHVSALARDMAQEGMQRRPVLVERRSMAILDGHHRFHAARALGLRYIYAVLIDYGDPRLTLASWTDRAFTPDDVRRAAASGDLLPAKSTRHILRPPLTDIPVPIASLMDAPAG